MAKPPARRAPSRPIRPGAKAEEKEPTKRPGTAVATRPAPAPPPAPRRAAPLPAVPGDYGKDADAGFEGMGREDFAIPFLVVLQSQSPQVLKANEKYIDGAEAGMIFNTVTKDLYPGEDGILFVPVHRSHQFIEWIPRDAGGGLVEIYQPDDARVLKAREGQKRVGKIEMENGHELAETFSVFGLLVTGEEGAEDFQQVIINFSSANIKHYKQWMTRAASISLMVEGRRVRPPLFAHTYLLTAKAESNAKGNWHGWSVAFSGGDAENSRLAMDAPWYQAAKLFRDIAMNDGGKSFKAASAGLMADDPPDGGGPDGDGAM